MTPRSLPPGGRSPGVIFGNGWLYAALGIAFGLFTLQGTGAGPAGRLLARIAGMPRSQRT